MKNTLLATLALVLLGGFCLKRIDPLPDRGHVLKSQPEQVSENTGLQSGDIIFQSSLSSQSKAIQIATKSDYSHCGLIFKEGDDYVVLEAVQPVKKTPLNQWIANGEDGKYVVKRLKNADKILTPAVLQKMKQEGKLFMGKNYDLAFGWSDDKIYCSELVWKVYQRSTGLEIGKLAQLKTFDLSNELVKEKLEERYGNNIPMEELVISPGNIFESNLLMTVKLNY